MRRMESDQCFVCGRDSARGLHLDIQDGPGWSYCEWTVPPDYVGYKTVLHGGIIAAILDDMMAHALYYKDIDVVTAHIELDYLEPIHVGDQIACRAEVARFGEGRSIHTKACVKKHGKVAVQASAVMVSVKRGEFSEED